MSLFVFAVCGAPANPFFFISHDPFQALSIISALCGILLIVEMVILSWQHSGIRLSLLGLIACGVGVLSLVIAIIATFSHVVCEGAVSKNTAINADLARQAMESEVTLMTLQPVVIAVCVITILLLLGGFLVRYRGPQS